MGKIRLLVVDDHAVLRAGLKALLSSQQDLEVVGEAADGEEALALVEELQPDLVLMDLAMPGMGGLEATRLLRQKHPKTKVLVLTMHEDEDYLRETLQAGGAGYVPKKAADIELLSAIRAVANGDLYLYPAFTRFFLEEMMGKKDAAVQPEEAKEGYELLSDREREVFKLVVLGHGNREIANRLFISVKTVETYKMRIMRKLGLKRRSELVRFAFEEGLVTLETDM